MRRQFNMESAVCFERAQNPTSRTEVDNLYREAFSYVRSRYGRNLEAFFKEVSERRVNAHEKTGSAHAKVKTLEEKVMQLERDNARMRDLIVRG